MTIAQWLQHPLITMAFLCVLLFALAVIGQSLARWSDRNNKDDR